MAEKKKGKSNTQLLINLSDKFNWLIKLAKDLGVQPPPQLIEQVLTAPEIKTSGKGLKRKRFNLDELLVTDEPLVYGSERNIVPPEGIHGTDGQFISEPDTRVFFLNIRGELHFQRESEVGLATTTQLIYLWKGIKKDSLTAEHFANRLEYTIRSIHDYKEALKKVANIDP